MKTVSLDLSKQLKESGYPQDTEFMWLKNDEGLEKIIGDHSLIQKHYAMRALKDIIAASPTADEILDQLPGKITLIHGTYEDMYKLNIEHYSYANPKKIYALSLTIIEHACRVPDTAVRFIDDSLADAAAKMWLYLKKEGLL